MFLQIRVCVGHECKQIVCCLLINFFFFYEQENRFLFMQKVFHAFHEYMEDPCHA